MSLVVQYVFGCSICLWLFNLSLVVQYVFGCSICLWLFNMVVNVDDCFCFEFFMLIMFSVSISIMHIE